MEQLGDVPINVFDAGVIVVLLGSAIFAYREVSCTKSSLSSVGLAPL